MALRIRRIKKVFGYDKTKTEKYVVVPDRATVVPFEHLCDQIAKTGGINRGIVQATLYGLVGSMQTFIREGHAVRIDGFGTFIPSFNAKSSEVEKEANIDSITNRKLRFLPSAELRDVINNIEFEFDVIDSTNDSAADDELDEDEAEPGVPNP